MVWLLGFTSGPWKRVFVALGNEVNDALGYAFAQGAARLLLQSEAIERGAVDPRDAERFAFYRERAGQILTIAEMYDFHDDPLFEVRFTVQGHRFVSYWPLPNDRALAEAWIMERCEGAESLEINATDPAMRPVLAKQAGHFTCLTSGPDEVEMEICYANEMAPERKREDKPSTLWWLTFSDGTTPVGACVVPADTPDEALEAFVVLKCGPPEPPKDAGLVAVTRIPDENRGQFAPHVGRFRTFDFWGKVSELHGTAVRL